MRRMTGRYAISKVILLQSEEMRILNYASQLTIRSREHPTPWKADSKLRNPTHDPIAPDCRCERKIWPCLSTLSKQYLHDCLIMLRWRMHELMEPYFSTYNSLSLFHHLRWLNTYTSTWQILQVIFKDRNRFLESKKSKNFSREPVMASCCRSNNFFFAKSWIAFADKARTFASIWQIIPQYHRVITAIPSRKIFLQNHRVIREREAKHILKLDKIEI